MYRAQIRPRGRQCPELYSVSQSGRTTATVGAAHRMRWPATPLRPGEHGARRDNGLPPNHMTHEECTLSPSSKSSSSSLEEEEDEVR